MHDSIHTLINLHPNKYCEGLRLWLIQLDLLDVVILLMIYLTGYAFQTKQKI